MFDFILNYFHEFIYFIFISFHFICSFYFKLLSIMSKYQIPGIADVNQKCGLTINFMLKGFLFKKPCTAFTNSILCSASSFANGIRISFPKLKLPFSYCRVFSSLARCKARGLTTHSPHQSPRIVTSANV